MYWQLVDLVWLCYVPAAVSMTYRVAKNWNKYEKKVDMQRRFHSPDLCFLITTKRCGKVVQETIDAVHKAAKELEYEKYSVRVVADSIDNPCTNAEVQIVPASYKSVGKHKARALQYALESIPSDENTWIFHLDEESVMTTQCFQASLEYIVDGGKPIAEGPINYPNDIRNIFTLFLEGERSISCFYCVDQMENTPIWLHGSNLLVRSDVEHKVGWQFGDSLAEDQRFAYEAESKIGKDAFGWHGGLLLEKPAFSIKDAIKQRKRWFAGSLQNFKYLTPGKKVFQFYFLSTWVIGLFAALLSPFSWLGLVPFADVLRIPLTITLVLWLLQYQIGLHLNLRHTDFSFAKKLKYHFLQVVLCPIVGMLSTLPAFLALLRPPKSFEIVNKN